MTTQPAVAAVTDSTLRRIDHANPAYTVMGGCLVCFRTKDVITLPTTIEGWGQPVICVRCVKRMAEMVDFGNVKALKEKLLALQEELKVANDTIKDQGIVVESYEKVLTSKRKLDPTLPEDVPLPGMTEDSKSG